MVKRLLILTGFALGGCDQIAQNNLDDIRVQVAEDAVKQYEMVKERGTPAEKCVHSGLVAEAYLQAQKDDEYRQWKSVQDTDCAAAGI